MKLISRGIARVYDYSTYKENNKIIDCIFYNPQTMKHFFGNGVGGSKMILNLGFQKKKI